MKVNDVFWIVLLGAVVMYAYDKYESVAVESVAPVAFVEPVVSEWQDEDRSWIKAREERPTAETTSPFKCDGRTRCPQMRSCAEARFFIQSCPNTSMDGDRDGIPCEDQWCK